MTFAILASSVLSSKLLSFNMAAKMRGVTCAGTKLQRFRVLQSGAKLFETLVHPPPPPPKQCCCHDTSPYGSLKSIIQHCQWGEGGNSQQKIEVPVCGRKYVKMEKNIQNTCSLIIFARDCSSKLNLVPTLG